MCLADRYKTIYICASGSVGGARPCQGRGRGFESRLALFKSYNTISYMREWLSWWSTTLPRSGPRVRVPSRALLLRTGNLDLQGFLFFCCSVKVDYGFSVISIYFSDFPHYHLVWYNFHSPVLYDCYVVIPCYHLVWYNNGLYHVLFSSVVIPCYHLVWYNFELENKIDQPVVIPCYHLVWYNSNVSSFVSNLVVIPCYHLVWYNYVS